MLTTKMLPAARKRISALIRALCLLASVSGLLYLPRLPDVAESQLTLPHDALVVVIDILYLIFKFALALWQSLDNDVRPIWNMMCNKQTLTNLEFGLSHKGTDAWSLVKMGTTASHRKLFFNLRKA
jgi:hypothetical protein